jgi:hypothetical protein
LQQSPKLCPECLCEFVPSAQTCSDCNVPLVHPDDIERDSGEEEELPPIAELVPVRIAAVDWIRGFSEVLQDADIAHRVGAPPRPGENSAAERRSHDQGMAIYVLPKDHEQAILLDTEYLRAQIPDAAGHDSDAPTHADGDGCPACGDPVGPEDAECGGCGLPFIEVE